MRLFTSVTDRGCSLRLQEDISIYLDYEFKQLLIQIASNKLSSSLLKQNQVCSDTMIHSTNAIPSRAKASFLACSWMYQFSIQSVRCSISFSAYIARTAGLGFMNLLLSPIAAPWLVQNEEFKAPLQDQSCWTKMPDHFVLLYSTGSGCILSIHCHYQKWHTVCSWNSRVLAMWVCWSQLWEFLWQAERFTSTNGKPRIRVSLLLPTGYIPCSKSHICS